MKEDEEKNYNVQKLIKNSISIILRLLKFLKKMEKELDEREKMLIKDLAKTIQQKERIRGIRMYIENKLINRTDLGVGYTVLLLELKILPGAVNWHQSSGSQHLRVEMERVIEKLCKLITNNSVRDEVVRIIHNFIGDVTGLVSRIFRISSEKEHRC